MQKISKCILLFAAIILVGCVCIGLLCGSLAGKVKKTPQRPSIIVILADDLGWNDVSFHGATQIPTPNLDALAYNGIILQRHYVLPTCTPSRTAFLTGRYPIRTGMQGYPLRAAEPRGIPLDNTLLPEYLRDMGYSTHLVGKWHVGYYTKEHTPVYRGFDSFFGYYNGYIQYFNYTLEQNNVTGYDLHFDTRDQSSIAYDTEYITDVISRKAEEIIMSRDPTKPLYLQVAHVAPHASDAEQPLEVRNADEVEATFNYIPNKYRRKYAGMVSALDDSVGRIVEALQKADMLDNSIILFMSDNGAQSEGNVHQNYGSNYPLRGEKFTLFEGGVRGVACIFSPLLKKTSKVSEQLIHIADWLPTLYSAAGGNVTTDLPEMDGVDQWMSLSYQLENARNDTLLNIDEADNTAAAIMGRFKLIERAIPHYRGYYGDSGVDKLYYPSYNITRVLTCPAAMAISGATKKKKLKLKTIIKFRKTAKFTCPRPLVYPSCEDQCLFDIYADPCETTDLSPYYPEVVAQLRAYIDEYRQVLVPQKLAAPDPAGYPDNFDGVWMPWLTEEDAPYECEPEDNFSQFI